MLVVIAPVLTLLLYAAATNYAFVKVAGDVENIKQTLSDSGIYDSVLDGLLDESDNVGTGTETVSLKAKAVRTAAKQTLTPQFVQTNTEQVIDSLYRWLDGTTKVPDFHIDLGSARAEFAKNAGAAVTAELSGLPACPAGTSTQNFDVENAACLPKGVSPAAEGAKVEQTINSGEGFLDHPVFTAASIKSQKGGKPVFEDELKNAPKAYQAATTAPYVMGAVAILLAVAVVFLSATKRKGLRKIGIMLLVAGIFMLGAAYVLGWGVNQQIPKWIELNNPVLRDSLVKLAKDVGGQIENNYWIFGGVYTALGLGIVLGTAFIKKGGTQKSNLHGEGRNKEDRIDIKEPVQATQLADESPAKKSKPAEAAKTKTAAKPKPAAKPPAKPPAKTAPKKIIVQ